MKDILKKSSYVVVVSACVVFLVEAPLRWPDLSWFYLNISSVALNLCLAAAFIVIFAALSARASAGLVAGTLILLLLAVINYFKLKFLDENLYPWDMFLAKNVYKLMPVLIGQLSWPHYVAVIGAATAGGTVMIKLPFQGSSLRTRFVLVTLSISLLASVVFYRELPNAPLSKYFKRINVTWNQPYNYTHNGFLLTFLLNTNYGFVKTPHGYGKEAVLAAMDRIGRIEGATGDTAVKPRNIIVVLSEALWDPTLLPVKFSKDPLEKFRSLRESNVALDLVSPQFGGSTCNVEFEVLTGLSMYFLPSGSLPFQQYIERPLPSLASFLRERGYSTVAIHPFEKWFWNRSNVMPLLGFERFVSIEDFTNPEIKGKFVSDDEVVSRIIRETEEADGPIFLFAITMQNHGPYKAARYAENEIKVSAGENMPEVTRAIIETYTNGVFDADRALDRLVQYYGSSEKPTMIVYFGDHKPVLGRAYRILKYMDSKEGAERWYLQKSTEGLIWSNYGMGEGETVEISMNYLGPLIMEKAGLELPPRFKLLNSLRQEYSILSRDLVRTKDGQLVRTDGFFASGVKDPLIDDYRMLEYDLIFGSQYAFHRIIGDSRDYASWDDAMITFKEGKIAFLNEYSIGEQIDFGEDGQSQDFIVKGWSYQEKHHRWTEGEKAIVRLKLKEMPVKGLLLRATGFGFSPDGGHSPQQVDVLVNGNHVATWNALGSKSFNAVIPKATLRSEDVVIHFDIKEPASPCDLGQSEDCRRLGFGVTNLSLSET